MTFSLINRYYQVASVQDFISLSTFFELSLFLSYQSVFMKKIHFLPVLITTLLLAHLCMAQSPGQWKWEDTLNRQTTTPTFTRLSPLPLKMVYFKTIKKSAAIQLDWQTTNEQNSDQFIIEHSMDGQEFSAIGHLKAKGNASNAANSYTFFDNDPVKGNNYYRLIMTDTKGSNNYSNARKIYNGDKQSVSLYPNPAGKTITLQGLLEYDHLSVTDMYGKKLIGKTIQENTETIDISTLSRGIYLIKLNNNEEQKTLKLVKKN